MGYKVFIISKDKKRKIFVNYVEDLYDDIAIQNVGTRNLEPTQSGYTLTHSDNSKTYYETF